MFHLEIAIQFNHTFHKLPVSVCHKGLPCDKKMHLRLEAGAGGRNSKACLDMERSSLACENAATAFLQSATGL